MLISPMLPMFARSALRRSSQLSMQRVGLEPALRDRVNELGAVEGIGARVAHQAG